jgi:hypothetical protein
MPLLDNQIIDKHLDGGRTDDAGIGGNGAIPEALLRRAQFLLEPDRTIFNLLARGNVTRRQIARILNLPAGTVTRRIQRLANRLHDPLIGALLDEHCPLPPEHRQLGIEHFLQDVTYERLADVHQLSRYQVRAMIAFVRGWFDGARGAPTNARRARTRKRAPSLDSTPASSPAPARPAHFSEQVAPT